MSGCNGNVGGEVFECLQVVATTYEADCAPPVRDESAEEEDDLPSRPSSFAETYSQHELFYFECNNVLYLILP